SGGACGARLPCAVGPGAQISYALPKFVCSPMPLELETGCQQAPQPRAGGHWAGTLEEAKETILHLRETVVHQKETILDQRETVRELTAKLSRCEGRAGGEHGVAGTGRDTRVDGHRENDKVSLTNHIPFPLGLVVSGRPRTDLVPLGHKVEKPDEVFRVGFPLRTNYMYVKVKRTLHHEIFAFTVCLWLKSSSAPGVGTPFSYSVPGQANELVLIEWGNNPMELLINDKAATLPLAIHDAKWHHICVTWSTRDGIWESYQDGVRRGSGENLAPWHPIKPGGVFILGQEQDTLGGRFDATQAFIGELADFNVWSHVLAPGEVYRLATCAGRARGDLVAWAEGAVELHGGVAKLPFNMEERCVDG
uniref:Pentraxin (PTX) domain-containing protein n=1 Tax=Chrysemys picta bellii TaxID=8478 RepID=A0A8C3P9F0_CHRPI